MTWQIQEAKNKLSEVVENSIQNGPQIFTRHGKKTAVVISFEILFSTGFVLKEAID